MNAFTTEAEKNNCKNDCVLDATVDVCINPLSCRIAEARASKRIMHENIL